MTKKKYDRLIQAKISQQDFNKLVLHHEQTHISIAEIIRIALHDYLNNKNEKIK